MTESTIRVGSRKSELALIQTKHVIACLESHHPDTKFEIVTMNTLGDKILDVPLPKIGEKSLFTKELEGALASGAVDFVVHSLKDLPTILPEKMAIGAVLEREDPRDALVLRAEFQDHTLQSLPKDSTIGTSSLRRAAQLHRYYPHLKIENIRGNLNTRLKKLDDLNKFEAIILATAGLHRMGWHKRISKVIEDDEILYAVGQGAIAVECREKDERIVSLLKPLYDIRTAIRIIAERTFLKTLGGGCSAPVAVRTELINVSGKHLLKMTGAVWSLDGKEELKQEDEAEIEVVSNYSVCPYKDKCDNKCLKSNSYTLIESEEIPKKRMKLEPVVGESCPINLPIGADFMGKCPYLEAKESNGNSILEIVKDGGIITECPFRKKLVIEEKGESPSESNDVFCGLVPHPDVSIEAFKSAEKLGAGLAGRLIDDGAKEIMIKAQNIIRNSC